MPDCCGGRMESVTLSVSGMKCEGCVERVVRSLKALDGVHEASASLADKKVSVSYDPGTVRREDIESTIENLGYRVQR
ncbi:MAG TPA: heavy-metal-associated domain-containing protein [Firmicutes bacterium]|nr:heavy-metal-associated domain-containing protein [Bacillota bacterium]